MPETILYVKHTLIAKYRFVLLVCDPSELKFYPFLKLFLQVLLGGVELVTVANEQLVNVDKVSVDFVARLLLALVVELGLHLLVVFDLLSLIHPGEQLALDSLFVYFLMHPGVTLGRFDQF